MNEVSVEEREMLKDERSSKDLNERLYEAETQWQAGRLQPLGDRGSIYAAPGYRTMGTPDDRGVPIVEKSRGPQTINKPRLKNWGGAAGASWS